MKNKKGLSGIVTTLIIILLTLVAIGIIWAVVSNLLSKSSNTVDQTTRCLDVDVRATKVTNSTAPAGDDWAVTLRRSAGGTNDDIFAKVVIYNANGASGVLDFTEGLSPIEAATISFTDTTISSATKVEVTPYYIDENNKEKICTVTTVLEL